ncbi:hypothetical protein GCM10010328_40630 [Streptomyces rubiginosohelvolus]|uniref:Uncharacterized protein n=2 Tax=Streptomyces rubiginosohelvolus TaxID=67362 RepID=A0ABQ3BYL6_9ACTN|nr:hypothetical protein GCM10010328_40630 [Streptomyces pluricolorescens]
MMPTRDDIALSPGGNGRPRYRLDRRPARVRPLRRHRRRGEQRLPAVTARDAAGAPALGSGGRDISAVEILHALPYSAACAIVITGVFMLLALIRFRRITLG